jgi:hypothetical protein
MSHTKISKKETRLCYSYGTRAGRSVDLTCGGQRTKSLVAVLLTRQMTGDKIHIEGKRALS